MNIQINKCESSEVVTARGLTQGAIFNDALLCQERTNQG